MKKLYRARHKCFISVKPHHPFLYKFIEYIVNVYGKSVCILAVEMEGNTEKNAYIVTKWHRNLLLAQWISHDNYRFP